MSSFSYRDLNCLFSVASVCMGRFISNAGFHIILSVLLYKASN